MSVSTALIVTIVVVVVVVDPAAGDLLRREAEPGEAAGAAAGAHQGGVRLGVRADGPEKGSEEEAERELRRRRGSVERNVEPLPDERREHFEAQWGEVERVFVENPEKSIEMADRTVSDILHERRFVTDSSQSDEETEKNLAVLHPDVADDYREARRMRADVVARSGGSSGGDVGEQSTEDLRQAIQRYRAVYGRLIER
jgi:hypothetical protein